MPETSVLAIVALVFAAVGIVGVPVIPSIVAIVLAVLALKRIRESNGWVTGRAFAVAALWVASLGLAMVVAFLLFIFVGLPAMFLSGGWEEVKPCRDSGWYSESRLQAESLVPATKRAKLDGGVDCWAEGGEFPLDITTTAAVDEGTVEAAARADGWTGLGLNPQCLTKTIAGRQTYLQGSSKGPNGFWLAVSTDRGAYCT